MSTTHHDADDTGKLLRPPVTEKPVEHADAPEDVEDSTTLKFDGPVRISDEDVGADPYNRTGKFQRLIRG